MLLLNKGDRSRGYVESGGEETSNCIYFLGEENIAGAGKKLCIYLFSFWSFSWLCWNPRDFSMHNRFSLVVAS